MGQYLCFYTLPLLLTLTIMITIMIVIVMLVNLDNHKDASCADVHQSQQLCVVLYPLRMSRLRLRLKAAGMLLLSVARIGDA